MNLLVTLLYEGKDKERLPLYRKWVSYYESIRAHLPWDKLLLIDNASSPETLAEVLSFAPHADIIRFSERLNRTGQHQYPYCWRALKFTQTSVSYYNPTRLYCFEPDFFVLSEACCKIMRETNNDWYSLWSPYHNFPAIEGSWIHGTGFDKFKSYDAGDIMGHDEVMEEVLPYTPIKNLNGDRHGELIPNIQQLDPAWDYVGQLNAVHVPVCLRG